MTIRACVSFSAKFDAIATIISRRISSASLAIKQPQNFVDNRRVIPKGSENHDITEPATGKVLCKLPLSNSSDVNEAVNAAHTAFVNKWSKTSGFDRGSILGRASQIIRDNVEQIALLEVRNCGKPIWEARFDVLACADAFQYFGGLAQNACNLGSHIPLMGNSFAYIRREPLGVCAGIGAWNFPFLIASWKAGAALASGNTIVFKPSEFTPFTAVILGEVLCEAGLPGSCFNVIQGDGKTGNQLCLHPNVSKVSFTGSVPTGSKVMKACSDGIKKVTLELGGKSPLIIFDDTDVENAVKVTMMANFLSQGQVCSNGTRVYVHQAILPTFISQLVQATQKLRIGNPVLEDTQVGATINEEQAQKVLGYIEAARHEGANVLYGGERVYPAEPSLKDGYYLSPCVLGNLHDEMSAVTEEIFGAVASVLKFESEDEVIERANNSNFGLAGAVLTNDIVRAHRIASELQVGTVWINNYNIYPPEIPFGGYKMSGIGRENGLAVIDHYTQLKSVYVEMDKNVHCPLFNL